MKNEIGSFYEKTYIETKEYCKEGTFSANLLLNSGREAIGYVINNIEHFSSNLKKVCVLPMYTCDTVVIPFQQRGWKIYYYNIHKDLSINKQEFLTLMHDVEPEVLLVHTYYGVDTIKSVRGEIARMQKEKGLIFIEDLTQSLGFYGEIEGADYYVGSLRKWFPITDGGFVSTEKKLYIHPKDQKNEFVKLKKHAQQMKYLYLNDDDSIDKADFLAMNRKAEDLLYKDNRICKMSDYSIKILKTIDTKEFFEIRSKNGLYLYKNICQMHHVCPVLNEKNASYLYYPIYTDNRNRLQEYLTKQDIYAPVLWPICKDIERHLDADTQFVYDHLLALPCDQRYSIKDMKRIIDCLREYDDLMERDE